MITRGGGPSKIIDDGRTSFLVPPADPKALATTLRSILDQAYPIRPLTEAARMEAVTRFSRDTLLARIDAVLDPFLSS